MSVHAAIATRYCAPEWCTLFEVSNDAGFNRTRSADAIAMNLYPSRGLCVYGFEIKVSRSDWLRELKSPDKSAPIQKFCDRWWVAVSEENLVEDGELPETWGLLVLDGKKLRIKREAPQLQPEPLSRGFIAAMLKRATSGMVSKESVNEVVEARLDERIKQHHDNAHWERDRFKAAHENLAASVKQFEEASGINISCQWDYPAKTGAALRAILDGGVFGKLNTLQQAINVASNFATHAKELSDLLGEIDPKRESA